jgi:acetyltransferase-like isoleucine patch superfamily enzyme
MGSRFGVQSREAGATVAEVTFMKILRLLGVLTLALLPSFVKIPILRMRGARIADGARISIFAVLWAEDIQIGEKSKISAFSLIRCKKLVLGNRVHIKSMVAIDTEFVKIGHDSIVMEQVVVGGMKTPRSSLTIGARVKIFPFCFINPTEPVVIEDEVGVGGSTYIFTHGSWQSALDGFPIAFGPITIRKGVWLPWRVFILPNVEIGELCTIGAGSVINKSLPAGSLAAGIPAKVIATDGAYLKPKSPQERLAYVDTIFSELFDLLRYEGAIVEVSNNADGFHAVVARRHHPAESLTYSRMGTMDSKACDVLVTYDRMPAETVRHVRSARIAWLDLDARECVQGESRLAMDVRNFFGRYGVRFAIHGELPV